MSNEGPPAVWRNGPFRLNPGKYLKSLANYNPQLPLAAANLPEELQQVIHDNLQEYEKGLIVEQTDLEKVSDVIKA